eukprot:COSAG01_NODE_2060_length_8520_cov_4.178839_12_plen_51_part_00
MDELLVDCTALCTAIAAVAAGPPADDGMGGGAERRSWAGHLVGRWERDLS